MTEKEIPVAVVIARHPNRHSEDAEILIVRCPYCGKKHEHGTPKGRIKDLGSRGRHCIKRDDSEGSTYQIVDPGEKDDK